MASFFPPFFPFSPFFFAVLASCWQQQALYFDELINNSPGSQGAAACSASPRRTSAGQSLQSTERLFSPLIRKLSLSPHSLPHLPGLCGAGDAPVSSQPAYQPSRPKKTRLLYNFRERQRCSLWDRGPQPQNLPFSGCPSMLSAPRAGHCLLRRNAIWDVEMASSPGSQTAGLNL